MYINKIKHHITYKIASLIVAVVFLTNDLVPDLAYKGADEVSTLSPTSRFSPIKVTANPQAADPRDAWKVTGGGEDLKKADGITAFKDDIGFAYISVMIGQFLDELQSLSAKGVSPRGLNEQLDGFKAGIERTVPHASEKFDRYRFKEMTWDGRAVCLPWIKESAGNNSGRTVILRYSMEPEPGTQQLFEMSTGARGRKVFVSISDTPGDRMDLKQALAGIQAELGASSRLSFSEDMPRSPFVAINAGLIGGADAEENVRLALKEVIAKALVSAGDGEIGVELTRDAEGIVLNIRSSSRETFGWFEEGIEEPKRTLFLAGGFVSVDRHWGMEEWKETVQVHFPDSPAIEIRQWKTLEEISAINDAAKRSDQAGEEEKSGLTATHHMYAFDFNAMKGTLGNGFSPKKALFIGPYHNIQDIVGFVAAYPEVEEIHLAEVDAETFSWLQRAIHAAHISGPRVFGYRTTALALPEALKGQIDLVYDKYVFAAAYFSPGQIKESGDQIKKVLTDGGVHVTAGNADRFPGYPEGETEMSLLAQVSDYTIFVKDGRGLMPVISSFSEHHGILEELKPFDDTDPRVILNFDAHSDKHWFWKLANKFLKMKIPEDVGTWGTIAEMHGHQVLWMEPEAARGYWGKKTKEILEKVKASGKPVIVSIDLDYFSLTQYPYYAKAYHADRDEAKKRIAEIITFLKDNDIPVEKICLSESRDWLAPDAEEDEGYVDFLKQEIARQFQGLSFQRTYGHKGDGTLVAAGTRAWAEWFGIKYENNIRAFAAFWEMFRPFYRPIKFLNKDHGEQSADEWRQRLKGMGVIYLTGSFFAAATTAALWWFGVPLDFSGWNYIWRGAVMFFIGTIEGHLLYNLEIAPIKDWAPLVKDDRAAEEITVSAAYDAAERSANTLMREHKISLAAEGDGKEFAFELVDKNEYLEAYAYSIMGDTEPPGDNAFRVRVRSDGKVAGYIDVYKNYIRYGFNDPSEERIVAIGVLEAFSHKRGGKYTGIGRSLMSLAMGIVKSKGYSEMIVMNAEADSRGFYQKIGFNEKLLADPKDDRMVRALVFKFSERPLPALGIVYKPDADAAEPAVELGHNHLTIGERHVVSWSATDACPYKCIFCGNTPDIKDLSTEAAKELMFRIRRFTPEAKVFIFSGGEPTLRKDLPELIDHAHGLGFDIRINTSGINLTEEILTRLEKYKGGIRISLHSCDEEIEDRLTNRKGHLGVATRALEVLAHRRIATTVVTVVTAINYERVKDMIGVLSKYPLEGWRLQQFVPRGRGAAQKDALGVSVKDFSALRRAMKQVPKPPFPIVCIGANSPMYERYYQLTTPGEAVLTEFGLEREIRLGSMFDVTSSADLASREVKAVAEYLREAGQERADDRQTVCTIDKLYEKAIVNGVWDAIVLAADEAQKNGQKIILALDDSWIPRTGESGALNMQMLAILNDLPEKLRKRGVENVVFVRGRGEDVIGRIMEQKDERTPFGNIIVIGGAGITDIGQSNRFMELRGQDKNDHAFLFGVDPENLSDTTGRQLLEMYLLALKVRSGGDISPLDQKFIKVSADIHGRSRVYTFKPVAPYNLEEFRGAIELYKNEIENKA